VPRQINLICVPQLTGVQGPLAAQIGGSVRGAVVIIYHAA
jgi:hypothetical protein